MATETSQSAQCCHLHKAEGCCDLDDCGPCCENCPTCPALARRSAESAAPMVYAAGPITGDPFGCVRKAMPAFRALLNVGCVPFMPQFSVIGEMVDPIPYEEYLTYDFNVIRHCEALLRLPGQSPGADREVVFAREIGVPVFYWGDSDSMGDFYTWVASRFDGSGGTQ